MFLCAIVILASLAFIGQVGAVSIMNGQATIEGQSGPSGILTMNLESGWNIVPLKNFFSSASGRYWDYFRNGKTTCDQSIFQSSWMYLPSQNQYHKIAVIDDWISADTRDDSVLLSEKQSKSYNGNSGSVWVYTPKSCALTADDGAYWTFPTMGDYYTLKAGWNFFVIDRAMAAKGATLKATLNGCNAVKYNMWNNTTQSWKYNPTPTINDSTTDIWSRKLTDNDAYTTVIVKTTTDCQLTTDSIKDSTAPPTIPN